MAAISASVNTNLARRIRVEWQHNFVPVVEPQPRTGFIGAQRDAGEASAAVDRRTGLGAREVAGVAVPVLRAGQRSVDAGGAHLERPGAW